MGWIITKYLVTAGLVVLISEVAKRSDKLGAFIASLPTVTILVLFWLFVEGQSDTKIGNHAFYTFWYVLPTLPMFLVFPLMLMKWGFGWAFLGSILITFVCFGLTVWIARYFGVELI